MNSSQPTLLIIILHDADHLPALLEAWHRVGVPGATILPSAGGHETEKFARKGGLSQFLNLFDQGKSPQRTVLSVIDDPEILEVAIAEADRVVKGFSAPKAVSSSPCLWEKSLGFKNGVSPKETQTQKKYLIQRKKV